METNENKYTVKELIITLGIFILFAVTILWAFFYIVRNYTLDTCGCRIPILIIIIIIIAVSIFSGAIVTFLFLSRREEKKKVIRKDSLITLRFLENDERRITRELIKANGELLQSEIVKKTNLNKVRVTRSLAKLENRGIIKRENLGATKKVTLVKELRDLFSCEACK